MQHDTPPVKVASADGLGPTVQRDCQEAADGIEIERDSRGMFVARLENMQQNGNHWLTVTAVLALLNDCDMLASSHAFMHAQAEEAPRLDLGA